MIVIDERVFAIRIIDTFAIPFPGSFITCLFVTISHNVIMPRILNMLWFHISQQCGDRYATVNYIKIFIIDTNISNHTSYLTLVCELWVSVARTLANLPTMMTSWNGNIFRATGLLWGGIHRSLVNSMHKGQRRGALMFSLIWSWTNRWTSNSNAGDLILYRAHYDVIAVISPHVNLKSNL